MPGCCPPQTALGSGNARPLYPQAIDVTGLKSLPAQSDIGGEWGDAGGSARAISARHAADAERRRTEWLAVGLPHNSSHLFARLPFADAVRLAALVGTGQLTWAEVNAALDAGIKLAIACLRAGLGHGCTAPGPHQGWEQARRASEYEIWARYHAKCDALFAAHPTAGGIDRWSTDHMRDNERILNRLRNERDRALAALSRRLGPQPPRQMPTAPNPAATVPLRLAAAEREALRKLDASGFVGSQSMADAILDLAASIAGTIERCA